MDSRKIQGIDQQTKIPKLRKPWLLAAWPGMGSVSSLAAAHLVQTLKARPLAVIPEKQFFSIDSVQVDSGIARSAPLPRSMFFVWRDPQEHHDLVLFIGEAQPETGGYDLCHRILDFAQRCGVERVITFAAMASMMHPSRTPRVFGAVTVAELLPELRGAEVELLADGQISGLNGALLAAAAERTIPAMCLLGEMPHFAAAIPNPKSSLRVLEVFRHIAEVDISLDQLAEQSQASEAQLTQLYEQLRERLGGDVGEDEFEVISLESSPEEGAEREAGNGDGNKLDPAARRRIERLFHAAEGDKSKAMRLKEELDKLGVFKHYEDRFLDLFRDAG